MTLIRNIFVIFVFVHLHGENIQKYLLCKKTK